MISIQIESWDERRAWTTFQGLHLKDLERRLIRLTGQQHTPVKKLVRQLKRRERLILRLPKTADPLAVSSLASFLESLGARVVVTNVAEDTPKNKFGWGVFTGETKRSGCGWPTKQRRILIQEAAQGLRIPKTGGSGCGQH